MGKLQFDNDWLVANIRGDVQDYYAWYVQKLFGVKLHVRSLRGAHVSVIRGEKPKANADKWGQENGDLVKIKYSHNIYTNGEHWWLNVECEDLAKIRGHYGLGTNKKWFHLTIGRL